MNTALEKLQILDTYIIRLSDGWHSGWLTKFFLVFTYSGYGLAWLSLVALMNALKYSNTSLFHEQLLFHECLIAALFAWGSGYILKKLVNRSRPFEIIEGIKSFENSKLADRSFPSNHTAAAVAFAFALFLTGHPYAPIVGTWALFVSLSRYYLRVHFPSDILFGVVLGLVCGYIALPYIDY